MRQRLEEADIAREIGRLQGWERRADSIRKEYRFPGFPAALDFVVAVAALAEEADHHPDIDIRYDRVVLSLSTHSAGGLTMKDFELARRIDAAPAT